MYRILCNSPINFLSKKKMFIVKQNAEHNNILYYIYNYCTYIQLFHLKIKTKKKRFLDLF